MGDLFRSPPEKHVVTSLVHLLAARGRVSISAQPGSMAGASLAPAPLAGAQPIAALRESWGSGGGIPGEAPRAAGRGGGGGGGGPGEQAEGGGRTLRLR